MKRFTFPLETLLRVRELREREAKRAVAVRQSELARIDRLSEATRREIHNSHETLRSRQSAGPAVLLHPAELARQRAWIAHLQLLLLQQQQMRIDAAQQLAQSISNLNRARTSTKTVEKLKSHRLAAYRKRQNRHEQAASDDLAQQLLSLSRDEAGSEE